MKTFFSIIFALAVSIGTVRAEGPIQKATDVAEDTAETAKNVGHSVAKGTEKAVNTIVDALTPEPDARRVDVTMSEYKIDMPTTLKPGKTAFVVKNAGKKKHNFEVKGNGIDQKFQANLGPNETKVLHVVLKRGTYAVTCPVDFHPQKGMKTTLTVH
jgi:plastocyanin